jgi:hypothetical protein
VARFSSRFKYDPKLPRNPVVEEAPEGMRIAYMNAILAPLCWDGRYSDENSEGRPLENYALKVEFCANARQEIPDFPARSSHWSDLKDLLANASWFNFYDFVESVGKMLKSAEEHDPLQLQRFSFATYQQQLNELFSEDRIGWRLNDKSELERHIPASLAKRLAATDAALADKFEPARRHYQKAIGYTMGTQPDPENAIKEVTSAIESVGRVLYPQANTLGKVVKEMEKEDFWPSQLVSMIEKYWAYASSEPAVRHGGPVSSRVLARDAEFCLHVGAAIIRYLVDTYTSRTEAPF